MTDSLTRALGMIGAHVLDRHALQAGETAFENTFGRARAAGKSPDEAFDEALEAQGRVVKAASRQPRAANDDEPLPDTHLDACLVVAAVALNEEPTVA